MANTLQRPAGSAPLVNRTPRAPLQTQGQTAASSLAGSGGSNAAYMQARGAAPIASLGTTTPKPAPTAPPPMGGYNPTATNTAQTAATGGAQQDMQKMFASAPGGANYQPSAQWNVANQIASVNNTAGVTDEQKAAATQNLQKQSWALPNSGGLMTNMPGSSLDQAKANYQTQLELMQANRAPQQPPSMSGNQPAGPGQGPMPSIIGDPNGYLAWQKARDAQVQPQLQTPVMAPGASQYVSPGQPGQPGQEHQLGIGTPEQEAAAQAAREKATMDSFNAQSPEQQQQFRASIMQQYSDPRQTQDMMRAAQTQPEQFQKWANQMKLMMGDQGLPPAVAQALQTLQPTAAAPPTPPKPSAPPKMKGGEPVEEKPFMGRTTSMQRRGPGVGEPKKGGGNWMPGSPKKDLSTAKKIVKKFGGLPHF